MTDDDDDDDIISLGGSSGDDDDDQDTVPDELCQICGTYATETTQEVGECGCCYHKRCWENWLNVFLDCPTCTVVNFNGGYEAGHLFYCPVKGCSFRKLHSEWKAHMVDAHQVLTCGRCHKNYMKHNKVVHKTLDCMDEMTQVRCPANGCDEALTKQLADMACDDPNVLVDHHECKHVLPCSSCDGVFLDQARLVEHYERDACVGGRTKRRRRAAVDADDRIEEAQEKERRGAFGKGMGAATVGKKYFDDVMNGD